MGYGIQPPPARPHFAPHSGAAGAMADFGSGGRAAGRVANMGVVIIVLIALGLGLLFWLRSGGLVSCVYVPDGENWQTFYMRRQRERAARRWGRWQWWAAGAGLGLAAAAGVLYLING